MGLSACGDGADMNYRKALSGKEGSDVDIHTHWGLPERETPGVST